MVNSISQIFVFLLLLLPLSACNGGKSAKTDIGEIEHCDSIPDGIKRLVRAVAENDSADFSALVSYPLSRPYPLHDIETPEQMRDYYSVMVDDSLKDVITHSIPSDWVEYGWRGWSLKGGNYLWLDEDLYDVSYVSAREKMMLDSLTLRELNSLDSTLRSGWMPVMCLKGLENGAVYRIDSSRDNDGAPHYRMLVYQEGTSLGGKPSIVLQGHKEVEGTAGTTTYFFISDNGIRALYEADIPDGSAPKIEFTYPDAVEDSIIPVTRAYWLDLAR